MTHALDSFRLKMNRAQEHANALNFEIDAWLERHPYEVFGEYQPGDPEHYVFRVRFFEDVPARWGLILGDFAHNARSAFDHLAESLVRANGGTPTTRTQFPVCVAPCDWEAQAARLKGASERHISMVEAMQPYHRRDLYGCYSIWAARQDALAILNQLSNVDKHRVLNPTPAVITGVTWEAKPVQDVEFIQANMIEIRDGPVEDGAEMFRFIIRSSGANPEIYLNRTETIEIRVQHRIDLPDGTFAITSGPLKEALHVILGDLRNTFKIFVGEFR